MRQPTPVLLTACRFPPENIVGSLRPGRFFRYLPEVGYEPYVLTASPQPRPGPRVSAPAERAGAELLRRQNIRLIVSTSPPYSVHSAAAALAGNASRGDHPVHAWIDRRVERTILSANRVVLNTEAAQAGWKRRHPAHRDRLDVIYNGFDPASLPEPARPIPVRQRRILLHAGSLYNHQYVELLLRALRGLALDANSFQFQLIGSVPDSIPVLEDYKFLTAQLLIDNAGRHLPQAEAHQRMRDSDYLLLVDYYREGGSLQLPPTIFDYLPVGRPILAITTPGSPMHRILELSGLPHVALFPSDSAGKATEKIRRLLTIPAGPYPLSADYLRQFDGREQTAALSRILDSVM
jgi:glycosyltransferase involved in cell wall biosynthesis